MDDDGEKILVNCFGPCNKDQQKIIDALRERGLWASALRNNGHRPATAPVKRWELRDEGGEVLAIHCRQDRPDGKRVWWTLPDGSNGLNGRRTETLPLYGVDHLQELPDGAEIVVTEGEPARDALHALGIASVATVCGAAITPADDVLRPLTRLRVYLWPDTDEAGRAHMNKIAAPLVALGAEPKIIEWPDALAKGDAADLVEGGGTAEDVRELIANAAPWTAPPNAGPVLVRVADVEREEVAWRWRDRLPLGKLTLVAGDPGVGKSWLACAVATPVSTGAALPGDHERHDPASVLILTAEDGLANTVRPRLEDMGADLTRVAALTAIRDSEGREQHVDLTRDLIHVEDTLARGGYALVIIDPNTAYLGASLDTQRTAGLRAVLTPLAMLAERYSVAVLAITHLRKSAGDRALYRIIESISYTAAARVVHLVGTDPDDERRRVLATVKNNLAPPALSLAFEIVDGRFVWIGESSVSAAGLLGPESTGDKRSALEQATDFLRVVLSDGPRPAKEIEAEAREAGVAMPTLKRARSALGVRALREQSGFGGARGRWLLALAADWEAQGDHHRDGDHLIPLCAAEPGGGVGVPYGDPLVEAVDLEVIPGADEGR